MFNDIVMCKDRFPGLKKRDDIVGLLNLLASKNPSKYIISQIAAYQVYDICETYNSKDSFWNDSLGCDPDFVPDYTGGYCYKVMPEKSNKFDGEMSCSLIDDAELLKFDRNIEAKGFISLLSKGKNIFF